MIGRSKVEARNDLETYIYNLKTSCEDSLKNKIAEDDLAELKAMLESGLKVICFLSEGYLAATAPSTFYLRL